MAIKGIDISKWQTITDYDLINNNPDVRFVIHKATQGTTLQDSKYLVNMQNISKPKGAYHYYRPKESPIAQARYFWDFAKQRELQGPPNLDVEGAFPEDKAYYLATEKRVKHNNLWACLEEISQKFGRMPKVYTAKYFWDHYIGSESGIPENFGLWVANYGVLKPNLPIQWTDYEMWQYTDRGTLPGITGSVDWNIFNGTELEFGAYFGGIVVPPPPPGVTIVETIQLVVLASALNIRNAPSATATKVGSLVAGDNPCEFEEVLSTDGSKWSRIGWKQYACKELSNGTDYMKYA